MFPKEHATLENVLVFFTDKDGVSFDPWTFFHPKAIERRLKHGQDLFDPLDFPVRDDYLEEIIRLSDSIDVVLRWFNAISIFASGPQLEKIASLPFVKGIEPVCACFIPASEDRGSHVAESLKKSFLDLRETQISHMKGNWFYENGIDGRGIRIAIFDAGFPGVDVHPVFQHIRDEGRIVATRDFVKGRQEVFGKNSHGTSVMSVIGGMADSLHLGLATGADFLLARTETWTEYFSEEKNWLEAVEWADRLGADIINSSLGYTYNRYFPEDMDGNHSLVAKAAKIAFAKGILVVNAAGNEGYRKSWEVIGTPADVAEVVSVGALQYPLLLKASYSSRGPTADGRMKPNVSALGTVVAADKRGFRRIQGTSFSSPLVAGFAACLWQKYPEWTNQQVFEALQQSSSLFPYYDYSHGFGIPQADYFFRKPDHGFQPSFDLEKTQEGLNVVIRHKNLYWDEDGPDKYLYYQIRDVDEKILEYFVLKAECHEILLPYPKTLMSGQKFVVHFEGHTVTWNF